MKRSFQLFTLLLALFAATSCEYNIEEELYPPSDCIEENVSYDEHVLPILQSRCYNCHDDLQIQGGITLEGYSNTKIHVDNGRLIGSIRHDSGFSPMPQNQGVSDVPCSLFLDDALCGGFGR